MRLRDQGLAPGRLAAPRKPSSSEQMGMEAATSLPVNAATSLRTSEVQLSGPGRWVQVQAQPTLVLGSGHLACMQREGVSSPQHLLSSHDSLALISGPCGH